MVIRQVFAAAILLFVVVSSAYVGIASARPPVDPLPPLVMDVYGGVNGSVGPGSNITVVLNYFGDKRVRFSGDLNVWGPDGTLLDGECLEGYIEPGKNRVAEVMVPKNLTGGGIKVELIISVRKGPCTYRLSMDEWVIVSLMEPATGAAEPSTDPPSAGFNYFLPAAAAAGLTLAITLLAVFFWRR